MQRGDRIELRLDSLAFGGDAVGRLDDGRVAFVAGGVPGDRVEARVEEVKARHLRAEVARVLEPGAERVAPRCAVVDRCGGCQWQEASLAAQYAAKHEVVRRALSRLGEVEVRPLRAPDEATHGYGLRTRARLTVGAGGVLGFQGRRSHRVVDAAGCPVLDGALERALAVVRDELRLPEGTQVAGLVSPRGEAQVAIEVEVRLSDGTRERIARLVGQAGIVGVVLTEGRRHRHWGQPTLDCAPPDEAPFHAAADGFAQASHAGNRVLRQVVRDEVAALLDGIEPNRPGGLRLLELHAGDGNFTRDLVRRAGVAEVVAVEGDGAACERLRQNVTPPMGTTLHVHAEPVERAVRRLLDSGARFDLVLLDPPRAGAADLAPLLPSLTDRVVYVSCDPMTLARDAATLAAAGLRLLRATPIDLMPHTFHVETVCVLARA